MPNKPFSADTGIEIGTKLLLFLVSPFISLIYSIKSLEKKSSIFVVFFFCVFFGLSFTVSNIRTPGSPDGVTYRALFEEYCSLGSTEYLSTVKDYFEFSGNVKDLYADTMSFAVSRISSNYHIFFLAIAIVFAFFQLKSLVFLTKHRQYECSLVCLLLVFLFTYVSIKNINGLRFWTAYWIACYSFFKIFIDGKKRYLALIAVLPLFHASYVVIWILFGLYYTTRRLSRVWTILLIISLFLGNYSLAMLRDSSPYLPEFFLRFVDYYASEEVVSSVNAAGSGYHFLDRIFPIIVNIYLNVMLLIIILDKPYSKSNRESLLLLSFTVILVSFSNFVMPIPSLGRRFMVLSYPLIAYLWLDVIGPQKHKVFLIFMPVVFAMSIYHVLEAYLQNVNIGFYFLSPVVDLIRLL